MTEIERLAAEHYRWLDNRMAVLRHEYAADDVLARRRAPRALVYRKLPRRPWLVALVDALGAAVVALFLVGVITLILTI